MAKVQITHTKNTKRLVLTAVVALLVAYGAASLAIDRGNWLWYGLCMVSAVLAIRSFAQLIRRK